MTSCALVLGGSGMLAGVVRALAERGWTVVVQARREQPLFVANGGSDISGVVHLVSADWRECNVLASRVKGELPELARLVVVWVHMPFRRDVLLAVRSCIDAAAVVIEVLGHDSSPVAEELFPRTTRIDFARLGTRRHGDAVRWLTNVEISTGVLAVIDEALAGSAERWHNVGE